MIIWHHSLNFVALSLTTLFYIYLSLYFTRFCIKNRPILSIALTIRFHFHQYKSQRQRLIEGRIYYKISHVLCPLHIESVAICTAQIATLSVCIEQYISADSKAARRVSREPRRVACSVHATYKGSVAQRRATTPPVCMGFYRVCYVEDPVLRRTSGRIGEAARQ